MLVFHGAMQEIKEPDISFSRTQLDFGKGFYLAKDYEQAAKWAKRFLRRQCNGVINVYELDMESLELQYRTKTFAEYNQEWLEFIIANRAGQKVTQYDIISGGIANDRVFNTVELYIEELISKEEALGKLQYQKPNWQICIRNQGILDNHLVFQKSEVCRGSE